MSTEKNELDAAIKKMRESIEELNKEGRTRLLKAFDTVNNHFKEVFVLSLIHILRAHET